MSVIIIGGGITGLSIGWYLARAGHPVTVLERGEAGHGATWASAGLLAPHVITEGAMADHRTQLIRSSHSLWPEFAQALEAASDVMLGYRDEGSLITARDDVGIAHLKQHQEVQQQYGIHVNWLSGDEARQYEPALSPEIQAAVYSRIDHQVENRQVAQALKIAFTRAGGILREHTPVQDILIEGDQVRGIRLTDETIHTDTVVVAAGAWSCNLRGLPVPLRPPVRPVKGQILAVQMRPDAHLIRHIVWGDVYIAPRLSGRLIIGATVEEQGFDTSLTAGGILSLLKDAIATIPGIADLPIAETWAGLRPGSADDAPILGPTAVRGLIMATGHFVHGIVLAPITAQTIYDCILSGETPEAIQPFGLDRFS